MMRKTSHSALPCFFCFATSLKWKPVGSSLFHTPTLRLTPENRFTFLDITPVSMLSADCTVPVAFSFIVDNVQRIFITSLIQTHQKILIMQLPRKMANKMGKEKKVKKRNLPTI